MYSKIYNCIVYLVSKKQPYQFNEEFKRGYKKSWIDNIKDYTP